MPASSDDSRPRPLSSALGADVAAHVERIVLAAEREAHAVEQALAQRRRAAEEEVRRYLAAARLHADADAAARAARLEALSATARRLADELADAAAAIAGELRRDALAEAPRPPWPPLADDAAPAPPADGAAPEPARAAPPADGGTADHGGGADDAGAAAVTSLPGAAADELPNAARLVAIEMAVGGSSRAEVEAHLRAHYPAADARPLLDDVFGAESHAASRLAWGEP